MILENQSDHDYRENYPTLRKMKFQLSNLDDIDIPERFVLADGK